MQVEQISILGSGSWGNSLAFLFGQTHRIILWDRNSQRVRRLCKTRRFKKPIRQKYPDNVIITNDLDLAMQSRIVINAISLKGMMEVFAEIQKLKPSEDVIFVNASKGIDSNTLQTPSEIIHSFLPKNPQAVLSGPNLSRELIKGKPMVTEVASYDAKVAELVQNTLNNPSLRVYSNDDLKGVELCGALKNVIAIASGCSDALKLGESAKASLITRGLKEIGYLLEHYNCKADTLLGPAGVGDLIVTCSSDLSRNYRVGYLLAEGKKLQDIVKNLGEVAEGINTAYAVYKICQEENLQLPIVEQVKKLLDGQVTGVEVVINLMSRPIKK